LREIASFLTLSLFPRGVKGDSESLWLPIRLPRAYQRAMPQSVLRPDGGIVLRAWEPWALPGTQSYTSRTSRGSQRPTWPQRRAVPAWRPARASPADAVLLAPHPDTAPAAADGSGTAAAGSGTRASYLTTGLAAVPLPRKSRLSIGSGS